MSILDVCGKLKDGTTVNIEVQLLNKKDHISRVVYYASKLLSGQLTEGEKYNTLNNVVSLSILDFNLFDDDEFYSSYMLRKKRK